MLSDFGKAADSGGIGNIPKEVMAVD